MHGKTGLLRTLFLPVIWLISFSVQLLPVAVARLILQGMRRVFAPSFIGFFFEDTFCAILKPRGLLIESTELLVERRMPIRVALEMGDYIQRQFYLGGYPAFTPALLDFCDATTLFFDIGANVGLISLAVAAKVPSKQIHAFEPIDTTFGRMKDNFARNGRSIHAWNIALSNSTGAIEFGAITRDSGSASAAVDYLTNRTDQPVERIKCTAKTFDQWWSELPEAGKAHALRVAMKIDVEGFEREVLAGMKGFLASVAGDIFVVCETHWDNREEIVGVLREAGFQLLEPAADILGDRDRFGSAQDLHFHRGTRIDPATHLA